ncbi:MAG: hypothetical protein R2759_21130, partial [Bacteroidales bacterium]
MNANTHKLLLSLIFVFSYTFLVGQDVIFKTNKDTISCKIKEIGGEEIKYTLPSFPSDLLFAVDKDKVKKIRLSNGQE